MFHQFVPVMQANRAATAIPRLLRPRGMSTFDVRYPNFVGCLGHSRCRHNGQFGQSQADNLLLVPLSSGLQRQLRWSSSKKRQRQMQKSGPDPFTVLGVNRSQTFVAVKRAFLQIAMKHHPDTTTAGTDQEREANKEVFVAARKAFEAMVAGPNGLAILKSETADYVEEDLDEWFKAETGYDMPFMDAATMKEVAEMTESVGGGLDRDGGMWTLARMVADTVKSGGDGRSLLQLEAGVVRDREIDGVLRRKKRR